ncbi:polysaccharide deacetylase family protein [Candidatus Bathyarchaeota archaeon]|nr:polysaccharide deacetylase family protein [Candidatus Bathyarchaeota archaeon]
MKWPNGSKAAFTLRADVETSNCLLKGVPALLKILEEYGLKATLFIPMGPDRTLIGFDRSRLKSYLRLSPIKKFGLKTILGWLTNPRVDMGELCAKMGLSNLNGHEIALHGYNHAGWAKSIRRKTPREVRALFMRGYNEYRQVFGKKPLGFASPEFKWTPKTLSLLDELGFLYGSDFRAEAPFKPIIGGRAYKTIQIPVTLPNLEELSWTGLSDNKAVKAIIESIEAKINSGGLAVLLIHPSYEALWKRSQLEAILKYVAENRDKLWTATMSEIARWLTSKED